MDPSPTRTAPLEPASSQVRRRRAWLGSKRITVCLAALLAIAAIGVIARLTLPADAATGQNLGDRLRGPSSGHLLGTDQYGRDLLARLILGTEVDLRAIVMAVGLAALAGVPLGILVGMSPAWVDRVVMRLVDAFLSVPAIVIALIFVAVMGRGLVPAMLGISCSMALIYLRYARSETVNLRDELFVLSARQVGASRLSLLGRHLLPSVARPLTIETAVLLRAALLAEATLSYFGLSVQPPRPTLGGMLHDAQQVALSAPWQVLPAGIMLMLLVFLLNFLSDGISEQLVAQRTSAGLIDAARGRVRREPGRETTRARETVPPLVIENLSLGTTGEQAKTLVRDVSVDVAPGEIVAIIGESGSGKTLTSMAATGLLPSGVEVRAGTVRVAGRDLASATASQMRDLRVHEVGVVFQNPLSSMNPSWTVGQHLMRPMMAVHGKSREQARTEALSLLDEVGVSGGQGWLGKYPHELSGGTAQRIMIATALIGGPRLIVADEPTSALDATVQVRVLEVFARLRRERGLSILLVTHSMGVVGRIADRVFVMYSGEIVESGPVAPLLAHPSHPYTQALLDAVPRNAPRQDTLHPIAGSVPPSGLDVRGCRFASRCPQALDRCAEQSITLASAGERSVRCVHARAGGAGATKPVVLP